MSVIIKGMKMPSSCARCLLLVGRRGKGEYFCGASKKVFVGIPRYGRRKDCPLVEIPSDHGRLIDGDSLHKKLDETAKEFFTDTFGNLHIDYISDEFNDAPVILDAEGE